jgi:hypothetical protein
MQEYISDGNVLSLPQIGMTKEAGRDILPQSDHKILLFTYFSLFDYIHEKSWLCLIARPDESSIG